VAKQSNPTSTKNNQAPNIVALTSPNNLQLPFKNFIVTKSKQKQKTTKKKHLNFTGQK